MPAVDIWDEMCTDNAHSHKPWEGNMEMVQQNGINTAAPYGNYDLMLFELQIHILLVSTSAI